MYTKRIIGSTGTDLMAFVVAASLAQQTRGFKPLVSAEEIKTSIERKPPLNRSEYRRRKKDQERHARLMQQDLLSEKSK